MSNMQDAIQLLVPEASLQEVWKGCLRELLSAPDYYTKAIHRSPSNGRQLGFCYSWNGKH